MTRERRLTITLLLVSALLAGATVHIGILLRRLDALAPGPADRPLVERAIATLARSGRTPAEWREGDVVVLHLGSEDCVEIRGRRRYSPTGAVCFGRDQRVVRTFDYGPPFP
ncbi:MAG: hypothetical protein QOI38_1510 [Sphingomonadales bacterium]|nr:hypothetical protein [Sphingomonadales bacterium]